MLNRKGRNKDSVTDNVNVVEARKTYPEVESVPGLFLGVNTISFGPADSPDISLMPLFEIDELKDEKSKIKMNVKLTDLNVCT